MGKQASACLHPVCVVFHMLITVCYHRQWEVCVFVCECEGAHVCVIILCVICFLKLGPSCSDKSFMTLLLFIYLFIFYVKCLKFPKLRNVSLSVLKRGLQIENFA